ncbi:putative protein KIAA0754 [Homo sapiens] [Rhizoctonia solani]|uniref:Uncharacterized protein n=1 Tax=Rhizoctonia solani TaxID=456999 RepID=A0A0K6GCX2_9AGAM|nr:putative protein KIAA0754 [Homo sapiens] [Rhizoctonia solani]
MSALSRTVPLSAVAASNSEPAPTDNQPQSSHSGVSMAQTYNLTDVYPCLGPVPKSWRDTLAIIQKLPNYHFLMNGADSPETVALCESLPSILDAFTQLTSRAMGAYLEVKAIWRNVETDNSLKAYSAITSALQSHQTEAEVQDSVARLSDLICTAMGETIKAYEQTYPLVYGSVELNGRPFLPPPHPNPSQRRKTLDNFLLLTGKWQGFMGLEWQDVISRFGTSKPAVDPLRYPPDCDWSIPMMEWPMTTVDSLYNWQLQQQGKLFQKDPESLAKAFQWLMHSIGEPYLLEPAPNGLDIFMLDQAAYYLAMKHHNFRDDAYMPPSAEPRKWFTKDIMVALEPIMEGDLEELIHLVEVHEKRCPPTRALKDDDHPLFLRMGLDGATIPQFVDMFQVPKYVYDFTLLPHHEAYNLHALWAFIVSQNSLALAEGLAGGETGVFRVILCLLVVSKLIQAVESGVLRLGPTESPISRQYGDGKAITLIIQHLTAQLKNPASTGCRPNIFTGVMVEEWRPDYIDLQMSGVEESFQMMWPYGLYGTHFSLGAINALGDETTPANPTTAQPTTIVTPIEQPDKHLATALESQGQLVLAAKENPLSTPAVYCSPLNQDPTPVSDAKGRATEAQQQPARSLSRPKPKPTSTQNKPSTSNIPTERTEAPDDSDDDKLASSIRESGKTPATDRAIPTALPATSDNIRPHRSLSADARPISGPNTADKMTNALGLEAHEQAGRDLTFSQAADESTPQARSRSSGPRPLALSQAVSGGGSTSQGSSTRPQLAALKTKSFASGSAGRSAVESPGSQAPPRSASSTSRQTPADETATSSLLGRAAGALARMSPIITAGTLPDEAGGSRTRATPISMSKRVTRAAQKRGHEEEGQSVGKKGKKQRSGSRAASVGEDDDV